MFQKFNPFLTSLVILLIYPAFTNCQNTVMGSRAASLAYSSVTLTDYWANNQATMSDIKQAGVAIYYQSSFMMKELSTKAVTAFSPVGLGVIGIKYKHFGYELYNDQLFGVYYARKIFNSLSVGLQLDLVITDIYEENIIITPTFEIGLVTSLSENLSFGVWTYNPISIVRDNNERLVTIFRSGFRWNVSKILLTTIEAEKNSNEEEIVLRAGAEYLILSRLFCRIGVSTGSNYLSIGTGLDLNKININISSVFHSRLGVTMQAGVSYQIAQK